MLRRPWLFFAVFFAVILVAMGSLQAKDDKGEGKKDFKGNVLCTMEFELRSWAAFYKSGKGEGKITCSNGQKAPILIRTHGGGVQFGKFNIANGSGKFSPVGNIKDLFGKYATVGGHGGAVKSRIGQSLSKGDISLDIKGTGTGVDFGFDFGSFRISPLTTEKAKEIAQKKRQKEAKEQEKKAAKQADDLN